MTPNNAAADDDDDDDDDDDADDDDVTELIEGLEQLVMEEHYEVEIEMSFKWKTKQQRQLADETATSKPVVTIN